MTHVSVSDRSKKESLEKVKFILFDYKKRNPLNAEAAVHVIDG